MFAARDPNLLKGSLDLILLGILEEGEKYGLEIILEANARTEGYFEFQEGTLYPALHRLEKAGLLEGEFRENGNRGPRRKYYQLTPKGVAALQHKQKQWLEFTAAMARVRPAYEEVSP